MEGRGLLNKEKICSKSKLYISKYRIICLISVIMERSTQHDFMHGVYGRNYSL
jgi:hypothetical protein